MNEDHQLLAEYVRTGSEPAFTELVRRHLPLVYSAALRLVRDPHLAQDVAQVVFANLARRAAGIPAAVVLAGWLHRDTRFTALDLLRANRRRARREEDLAAVTPSATEPPEDWRSVRVWLDDALSRLKPAERDLLLLRFFEQRELEELAPRLATTPDALRKRLERALDRLRAQLARRGIVTTGAALGAALSAHAVERLPDGLLGAVMSHPTVAVAIAAGPGSLPAATTAAGSGGKFAVAAVLASVGLIVVGVLQQRSLTAAEQEQQALRAEQRQLAATRAMNPVPAVTSGITGDDRADLERLRAAVPEAKARLAARQAERTRVSDAGPSSDTSDGDGAGFNFGQARDRGQGSPRALLETHVWALLHGQTNRMLDLMAFEPGFDPATLRTLFETIAQETAKGTENLLAEVSVRGVRLLEEQPAEGNDRWIVHEMLREDGTAERRSRIRVRPGPLGWQMVIGLDGQPVEETVRPSVEPQPGNP